MYYRDAGIQITRQLLRVIGQAGEEECDGEGGVTSAERVGGFLIPNFSGGNLGFFFENDELEQKLTFIEWFWYVEISS